MAQLEPISILGETLALDAGVFPDRVRNQISTPATSPSPGDLDCYVMADGGADEGLKSSFSVPLKHAPTGTNPKLRVIGILDGAPSAADTLGFGFRKLAVADNELADATFDAEQIASATIGSNGLGYGDKDLVVMEITLTAGNYSPEEWVGGYVYIDSSATTYTGNFLFLDAQFVAFDA